MFRTITAALGCVMLAILGGCGKSQPAGNQVAALPNEEVVVGTVTYQQTGPAIGGNSSGIPGPIGAALPPSSTAPAAGGTTTPAAGVAPMPGTMAASPNPGAMTTGSTSNVPPVANSPPATAQASAPSGSFATAPGSSTASVPGGTAPNVPGGTAPIGPSGNSGNPAAGQSAAAVSRDKANAVQGGNVNALVAAMNQWRSQGTNQLGVKRLNDKPVLAGYSWMIHLLPYLGHDDLYKKFDFNKGWHEPPNIVLACEEIPAFLDPMNRNRHMTIVGAEDAIGPAFTHYVGMSGVEDTRNLVAAELPRSDKRAGIFGYDQIAGQDQITDGTSNTVMLVSAGKIVGPWASGGGATVRGARSPYFDEITGFGSAGDPGAGVIVAMADGSVKRISKDIDPAVFRALCTMHGAESIDFNAHANVIRPQN